MIDFETILEAYLDCRKRKRSTVGATEFELDYVHNLVELMNEVNSRQYKIGKSICFVVRYPRYRLLSIVPMLRTELGKLGLRLNEKKFYLQHYSKGVQFTGAVIKPDRIYVANHTINSFALAVERLGKAAELGMINDIKKEIASVNSYLGIMSRYNEYATKRRIMAKLPPKFYEYCYIEGHFDVVKLKYKYTEKAIFMNIAKNIINKRDEEDIRESSDREGD